MLAEAATSIECSSDSDKEGETSELSTHAVPAPPPSEGGQDPSAGSDRRILDGLIEGCLVVGFDWRCLYANEAATKQAGRTQADLVGRTLFEVYPGAETSGFIVRYRRCMEERVPQHFEAEFTFPGAATKWFEVSVSPVPDGLFILSVDNTERRKAEEELRRSEQRHRLLADNARDVVWTMELDGRISYVSPAVEKVRGFTPAEAMSQTLEEIHPPASRLLTQEYFERLGAALQAGRTPESFRGELEYFRKDGSTFWTEVRAYPLLAADGTVLQILGVTHDIDERRRAEAALKESEELLRLAFENANIGMCLVDLQGRLTRVNRQMSEIFGYARAELEGMTVNDIAHPDFRDVSPRFIQRAKDGDADRAEFEKAYLHKDGHLVWGRVSSSLVRDARGEPACFISHVVDVSESRRAEEALRESEERYRNLSADLENRVLARTAELTDANRELDAYSYSVSHELRTPLRAIDGHAAVILEEHAGLLDDEGRRHFAQMRWNAQRMGRLLDDLLAFSRTGRTDLVFAAVDMTGAVKAAFDRVVTDPASASRISFSVGDLPKAVGDAELLSLVWENLLSNAVKFSAGRERPEIQVEGSLEAGEAVYRVRDNGVGFEMEYVGKLFGVFQRLHGHREFEGTGVGLALVRRIVLRHGGRVWADGMLDRGATFCFALPARGE
jgi:PAS domain S-box-containing protein